MPTSTRGGIATESLDPNLENEFTKEFATFIERELMPNFGVRAGYVWRGVRNQYARVNLSIPYSAFTVPVSVTDPGPDGAAATTADNGPAIAAFDLAQNFRGLTPVNQTVQLDDSDDDFHNFEITGTKRMSNRWSLLASYGYTKSVENTSGFQGHSFRSNGSVLNPNDLIGTEDGRFVYTPLVGETERNLELAVLGYFILAAGALPAGRPVRPHVLDDGAELRQRALHRRTVGRRDGRTPSSSPTCASKRRTASAAATSRCSSTSTTCSTRTRRRTCSRVRAPRSSVRSASSRRGWRGLGVKLNF